MLLVDICQSYNHHNNKGLFTFQLAASHNDKSKNALFSHQRFEVYQRWMWSPNTHEKLGGIAPEG